MDYGNDEAIAELQDEMYEHEEGRPKTGMSQFDSGPRFFIGLFVIGIIFLMFTEKITIQVGIMILVLGGLFLYYMKSNETARGELTWLECMIRINDQLKFLQIHPIGDVGQIPPGEIHVSPIGRKQWYEGQAFKRSYKVEIYDEELGVSEIYLVEVDLFTGDIISFKHSPFGVYGNETKDIKYIPTREMLAEKRHNTYLDKAYKKK